MNEKQPATENTPQQWRVSALLFLYAALLAGIGLWLMSSKEKITEFQNFLQCLLYFCANLLGCHILIAKTGRLNLLNMLAAVLLVIPLLVCSLALMLSSLVLLIKLGGGLHGTGLAPF
jgi:hypothetical protein